MDTRTTPPTRFASDSHCAAVCLSAVPNPYVSGSRISVSCGPTNDDHFGCVDGGSRSNTTMLLPPGEPRCLVPVLEPVQGYGVEIGNTGEHPADSKLGCACDISNRIVAHHPYRIGWRFSRFES
jgi:hypothetical protein